MAGLESGFPYLAELEGRLGADDAANFVALDGAANVSVAREGNTVELTIDFGAAGRDHLAIDRTTGVVTGCEMTAEKAMEVLSKIV